MCVPDDLDPNVRKKHKATNRHAHELWSIDNLNGFMPFPGHLIETALRKVVTGNRNVGLLTLPITTLFSTDASMEINKIWNFSNCKQSNTLFFRII